MLRTRALEVSLWEAVLPEEVLRLPEELARVDALLDDPAFFAPFVRHPDDQTRAESVRLAAHPHHAQQFCAIRSYLSTAAKHGQHFFHTLVMLAEGRPWHPHSMT
jgi:hypothetical protein